jgi:hypothetical protein
MLSYWHEYIIDHRGSASLVRWWRILFWRSRHRRQRAWPDSADMPYRMGYGRIPQREKLTGGAHRALKWLHNQPSSWLVAVSSLTDAGVYEQFKIGVAISQALPIEESSLKKHLCYFRPDGKKLVSTTREPHRAAAATVSGFKFLFRSTFRLPVKLWQWHYASLPAKMVY